MWKERKETERQMEERMRQLGQKGEECISKRTSCGEKRGGGEVQERPCKRARKLTEPTVAFGSTEGYEVDAETDPDRTG